MDILGAPPPLPRWYKLKVELRIFFLKKVHWEEELRFEVQDWMSECHDQEFNSFLLSLSQCDLHISAHKCFNVTTESITRWTLLPIVVSHQTKWVGLVEAQVYIYATLSTLILCLICAPQTQPYLILFLLKL